MNVCAPYSWDTALNVGFSALRNSVTKSMDQIFLCEMTIAQLFRKLHLLRNWTRGFIRILIRLPLVPARAN
jgi:hypothetical protein